MVVGCSRRLDLKILLALLTLIKSWSCFFLLDSLFFVFACPPFLLFSAIHMMFSVLFRAAGRARQGRASSISSRTRRWVYSSSAHRVPSEWGETGCSIFPHRHIPFVPLVPADLAVIYFFPVAGLSRCQWWSFPSYQWALQSDHCRLPGWMWNKPSDSKSLMFRRVLGASPSAGLELFCSPFLTAGPIKASSCNFTVCCVKIYLQAASGCTGRLCEADTCECDLSSTEWIQRHWGARLVQSAAPLLK